jgi:hypothetical protein
VFASPARSLRARKSMLDHQAVLPNPSVSVRLPNCTPTTSKVASVLRTHFQVPYPVSPVFTALAKSAGGCTNDSPFGTRRSELATLLNSFRFKLLRTLLLSFALRRISTLFLSSASALFAQNTGGGGIPAALTSRDNLLFPFARPTMNPASYLARFRHA